jgi:hypothetical protein
MTKKSYQVELRGDTKTYRAEFGRAIKSNQGFTRSMRGLSQGAAAIDGPMGGVASRISVVNSLFSSGSLVIAGFAAGIAVLAAGTYKSLKVFDEYQRGQLKTAALIKSTGNAAGFSAKQMEEQANSVALNTLASVGGIVEAQNVLQTFKTVSGDTFKEAIVLSQDMAAVFGGSAKDKALQLGKALESPKDGLTALKRSGVTFTQSERDMVNAMQDAGNVAEAQAFILRKLRDQVGGAGNAEAGGLSGDVDTMSQRWDELLNAWASTSGSASVASGWINSISNGLKYLRESIDPTVTELEKKLKKLESLQFNVKASARDKSGRASEINTLKQQILKAKAVNGDMAALSEMITKRTEQIAEIEKKIDVSSSPVVVSVNDRSGRHSRKTGINTKPTKGRAERATRATGEDVLENQKAVFEKELAQYQTHYEKLKAAEQQHIETQNKLKAEALVEADKKAEIKQEKQEKLQARIDAANAKEIESIRNKFSSIHEAALSAEGKDVELQEAQYERKTAELDRQIQQLREKGLLTLELEAESKLALENLESEHQAKMTDIKKESAEKQADIEKEKTAQIQQGYDVLASALYSYFDGMQGKEAAYARAAISIGSSLLDDKKRKSITSIFTNTYDAAMGAYNALASIPFVGPVLGAAAFGGIMVTGTAAAAKVAGMAHNGMTNIPSEGTYLLDGGERVVQAEQNKDLTNFMKATQLQTNSPQSSTVNEFYVKAWDGKSVRDMLLEEGQAIDEALSNYGRQ